MKNLMDYIPKRIHVGIKEVYKDSDGYWITLNPGWKIDNYFAVHVIHEDTIAELQRVSRRIVKEERG